MKKLLLTLCFVSLFITGCVASNPTENSKNEFVSNEEKNKNTSSEKNNYVSYNGKLKVNGIDLVNQYDEKIILKGMSSHGLQWYKEFINEDNLKILKDEWKSNVFRIAMYTNENGYISNRDLLNTLEEKVDLVIEQDMYVIIDWHILSDNNPMTYKEEALDFFDKVSKKYKDSPNVIYEICNEPNGNTNWNNDIKPYADEVIKTIRKNSKSSVIIVGTPTWSQDILDPINNKIDDKNVMYALHFYAGTHKEWLRERITKARENGLPIFVSEWGTTNADGSGDVATDEAVKWVKFMNENNISYINWSLSDKDETSAILKPGTNKNGFTDSDLTESGQFIKKVIRGEIS